MSSELNPKLKLIFKKWKYHFVRLSALPSIKDHVFINIFHSAVKLQCFSLAYQLKMTIFEKNSEKPNFALNSQKEYAEETENTNLRGQ
jgi:hypothetical protein